GSLITVVGDVTGHGLHAAVMMSQLRTALRAYAVDHSSPGRLLTRLHQFLHHLQPDLFATAVIARFHPGEPTLTWAAAGHPPPVLRLPDGRVRVLDAKPGAMLGIPLHQEIADHTEPLEPGSTLALYTDGLVERRARGIDPGIARLAAALGSFEPGELDADPGATLGIPLHQEIADHAEPLEPGSTPALYTDGLVERRARGIDPGIARLAAALGSFEPGELDADPESSADRLLSPLLSDSERDDDICLLLCHLHG